jgi:hypothetical protein
LNLIPLTSARDILRRADSRNEKRQKIARKFVWGIRFNVPHCQRKLVIRITGAEAAFSEMQYKDFQSVKGRYESRPWVGKQECCRVSAEVPSSDQFAMLDLDPARRMFVDC